jgi:hypothetical protein
LPRGYRPRRPATTAFYRVIAEHLETMLQDARDRSPQGRSPRARLLARRDDGSVADVEHDALAQAESAQLPMMLADPPPRIPTSTRRRCAHVDGFSLHANTSVDAADRGALERLCRSRWRR